MIDNFTDYYKVTALVHCVLLSQYLKKLCFGVFSFTFTVNSLGGKVESSLNI